jgi:hypothetical protein
MTPSPSESVTYPLGGPESWQQVVDAGVVAAQVQDCREASPEATGKALEQLVAWLLTLIPGFSVEHANRWAFGGASEVDLSVFNRQDPDGLPAFPDMILVECKNRTTRMDSSEVAWFDWKLQLGGVAMGIIVSVGGITGDPQRKSAAWSIVARANSATPQRRILVVSLEEIANLKSRADLVGLLISKVSLLAMAAPQL